MASAARASSASRHQAQARRPSNLMTSSVGPSIFASIASDDEGGEPDQEVNNINSFYSPVEGSHGSRITTPAMDMLPRALLVPSNADPQEKNLRKKCAFYFMDPINKFIARRQTPWKLILQFAKIFLITAQILIFGQFRYAHTNYYKDNHIAFEHLFLRNWDSAREINAYPPGNTLPNSLEYLKFFSLFCSNRQIRLVQKRIVLCLLQLHRRYLLQTQ